MPAKVMVSRTDHTPGHLRELARKHRFRDRRRRLRAIALVTGGRLSRTGVASAVGVGVRTLRDRVVRYNAGGLDGLRDAARPGAPPKLESGQAGEVASWLDGGPDPDAGRPSRRAVADVRKRIAGSFGWGARWRARAGRCGGWASGTCPRGPSTRGRTPPPGRDSAGIPSGWRGRRCPTAWPRRMCPCTCRTGRGWDRRACCRGSGRGKGRARASCGTTGTDTCTCSPPPAPRRATRSGMSAAGPARSGWAGTSAASGSGSPPESAPWWSPAGRASAGRGTWGYRTASPCPGCRPRPGAQSGRDGFLRAEHRHFANRVSAGAEHVREVVGHVWDAFIGRKGEITRTTTREWAVP